MAFSSLYAAGCILLFLGMLWMFLPHVVHGQLLEDNASHLLHLFEGAIAAVLGVIFLVTHQKRESYYLRS